MASSSTTTSSLITLKGSIAIVTEFFNYSVNNILYQRGIYPPESFKRVSQYGLAMMTTADDGLLAYLANILRQLEEWLHNDMVQKLVLVVKGTESGEALERWVFDIDCKSVDKENQKGGNNPVTSTKSQKEITQEIQALQRQITASVTFLPLLNEPCSFDLLVYADKDATVPVTWEDSDPCFISNSEQVQLRSFDTKLHKVDMAVSYRVDDDVSGLNANKELDSSGDFTGSIQPQPSTTGTTIAASFKRKVDAQSLFKFYTTSDANDSNYPTKYGQTTFTNWMALPKLANLDYFENGDLGTGNSAGALWEGLSDLSTAVFGSSEAWDLFSNLSDIKNSYTIAFDECLSQVEDNNTTDSVTQLGNAIMFNHPERFTLQYTASVDDSIIDVDKSDYKKCLATGASGGSAEVDVLLLNSTTITSITTTTVSGTFVEGEEVTITDPLGKTNLQITISNLTIVDTDALNSTSALVLDSPFTIDNAESGVYTQLSVGGSAFGSGALCSCKLIDNDETLEVESLYVTTEGTGYLKDDSLILASSIGDIVASIASINSVQSAMLNGLLDSTAGTELPLESDDTIRVRYSIPLNSGQHNPSGEIVSFTSSWFMDFVVPA
jgi:mitotic spindle assembly checkpoint protein MAD2